MTDDLTDHLLATGPDLDDPTVKERWVCDSDEKATWCLRKLAAIQAERDRIKRLWEAEEARLNAWLMDADRPLEHDAAFFIGQLQGYRMQLEDENPDLPKTYKLPTGALARRAGRESTYIGDEDAFVAWAKDNCPDALRVTPKVTPLKDWMRQVDEDGTVHLVSPDGEVVPGVRVLRGEDRIEVRPAADLPAIESVEPF